MILCWNFYDISDVFFVSSIFFLRIPFYFQSFLPLISLDTSDWANRGRDVDPQVERCLSRGVNSVDPPTFLNSTTIPIAIMTLTKLNFITGNKNKLAEVRAILGSVIEVDNQAVEVPEIQGTIEAIAKEKACRAAEAVCSCCFPGGSYPFLTRLHVSRSMDRL